MLFMVFYCTDTVYILLLHSGLHLLHAPFGPKSNLFYGLLLLAMENKKTSTNNHSGYSSFFYENSESDTVKMLS